MFINKCSPSRSIRRSVSCPFAPTAIIIALRPRDYSAPSRQCRSQGGFGGYAPWRPWVPLRGLRGALRRLQRDTERASKGPREGFKGPPRGLQRAPERASKGPREGSEGAREGPLGPLKSQICVKTARRTKMGPFRTLNTLKPALGPLRSGLGHSRYEMGPLNYVMAPSGLG